MTLATVFEFIINVARFIILLGVLIFIHELGHFLAAKMSNVYVVRLSLGFGKRLFGFKKGETDYCVRAIPLGGYVKMVGQEDMPKTQEEAMLADPEVANVPPERRFDTQSAGRKLAISFAGPLMNLLFALPVLWLVYIGGINVPVSSEHALIGGVTPGSPAERAGIEPGQRVVSINGEPVRNWEDILLQILTNQDNPLDLKLEDPSGNTTNVTVTPAVPENSSRATIGIEPYGTFVVTQVLPGTPAARGGLKEGDLIWTYDHARPTNENIDKITEEISQSIGEPMVFTVFRGDRLLNLTIIPAEVNAVKGVEFAGNTIINVDKEKAGEAAALLKPGETVVAVNGRPVRDESLTDLITSEIYNQKEDTVELTIRKSTGLFNRPKEINVRLPLTKKGMIGVVFSQFVTKQFGFGESVVKALDEYGESLSFTMKTIYYLISGRVSTKEMAGPIGIAVLTTESLKLGLGYYLKLVAFITINLGIINLLPIPLLDGGLILITIVESVRRKPLEEKYLILLQRIGLAFIVFLVLLATYNDILRAINHFFGRGFMD